MEEIWFVIFLNSVLFITYLLARIWRNLDYPYNLNIVFLSGILLGAYYLSDVLHINIFIQLYVLLFAVIFLFIYGLLKNSRENKINNLVNYDLLLQLIVFNLLVYIAYYISDGSYITGYYINNDPVVHANFTRNLLKGIIPPYNYPYVFHLISAYFSTLFTLDIEIINRITVIFLFSYLVYPLMDLIQSIDKLTSRVQNSLIILTTTFSYLNINYLLYGFFPQVACLPFILQCLIMITRFKKDYNVKELVFFTLIGSTALAIYSFTLVPYIIVPLLILLVFDRNKKTIITLNFLLKIFFLFLLFAFPIIIRTLIMFATLYNSNIREASLTGVYGNLISYQPLPQIIGIWPFPDYRIIDNLSIYRVLASSVIFLMIFVISIYTLIKKYKIYKNHVIILTSFLIIYFFIRYILKSPYILGKHFSIASNYLIPLSLIILFHYKYINKYLYFIFSTLMILSIFLSSYIALKYIPALNADYINSIKTISKKFLSRKVLYEGNNDWVKYYMINIQAHNIHYQLGETNINNRRSNDYIIYDTNQTSEILQIIKEKKKIFYFDSYFVVLSRNKKDTNLFTYSYYDLYKLYEKLDNNTQLSLNISVYKTDNRHTLAINLNPADKNSCSGPIEALYHRNFLITMVDDEDTKKSDGVMITLKSNNKIISEKLLTANKQVIIKSQDIIGKNLCFDPINNNAYDWVLITSYSR